MNAKYRILKIALLLGVLGGGAYKKSYDTHGSNQYTNEDVTIYIEAFDEQSGIRTLEFPDGTLQTYGESTQGVDSVETTFNVSENGAYTFVARDIATNETEHTQMISHIDKESPDINISGNVSEWTNNYVELNAIFHDNQSGLAFVQMPDNEYIFADGVLGQNVIDFDYLVRQTAVPNSRYEPVNIDSEGVIRENLIPEDNNSRVSLRFWDERNRVGSTDSYNMDQSVMFDSEPLYYLSGRILIDGEPISYDTISSVAGHHTIGSRNFDYYINEETGEFQRVIGFRPGGTTTSLHLFGDISLAGSEAEIHDLELRPIMYHELSENLVSENDNWHAAHHTSGNPTNTAHNTFNPVVENEDGTINLSGEFLDGRSDNGRNRTGIIFRSDDLQSDITPGNRYHMSGRLYIDGEPVTSEEMEQYFWDGQSRDYGVYYNTGFRPRLDEFRVKYNHDGYFYEEFILNGDYPWLVHMLTDQSDSPHELVGSKWEIKDFSIREVTGGTAGRELLREESIRANRAYVDDFRYLELEDSFEGRIRHPNESVGTRDTDDVLVPLYSSDYPYHSYIPMNANLKVSGYSEVNGEAISDSGIGNSQLDTLNTFGNRTGASWVTTSPLVIESGLFREGFESRSDNLRTSQRFTHMFMDRVASYNDIVSFRSLSVKEYTPEIEQDFNVHENGEYRFIGIDMAENVSTHTEYVSRIDKTPPQDNQIEITDSQVNLFSVEQFNEGIYREWDHSYTSTLELEPNTAYTMTTDIPPKPTGDGRYRFDLFFNTHPIVQSSAVDGVGASHPRTIITGDDGLVDISIHKENDNPGWINRYDGLVDGEYSIVIRRATPGEVDNMYENLFDLKMFEDNIIEERNGQYIAEFQLNPDHGYAFAVNFSGELTSIQGENHNGVTPTIAFSDNNGIIRLGMDKELFHDAMDGGTRFLNLNKNAPIYQFILREATADELRETQN